MHILVLPASYPENPHDVRGVFFRDQALALQRYGHKVGVIAPLMRSVKRLGSLGALSRFGPSFEDDFGVLTYRRALWALFPRVPFGNYFLFLNCARQLLRRYIREQGKPDLIHAHCAVFAGAAAAALSEEFDIPFVLSEHSSAFSRDLYASWQLKLAAKAVAGARCCIAVSPALGKELSEIMQNRFGLVRPWRCVPNVVADRFALRAAEDCSGRPLRFLNLAMMNANKGQVNLLDALGDLIENGVDAELWIGGDGPLRPKLQARAEALKISERVYFLGLVPPNEVPELLRKVDIMVISSRYETFGVVAAEALMSGMPVISTRCGGPESIVGDGDGILVPVDDIAGLAAAMRFMADNPDHFDSARISARAECRFSGAAVSGLLTACYQEVCSCD